MALSGTRTYSTLDGGTVDVDRRGWLVDLHYRDAAGRTVATVEMSDTDALRLIAELSALA